MAQNCAQCDSFKLRSEISSKQLANSTEPPTGNFNRFSVLNKQSLRKIHQTFTPEELLKVQLVNRDEGTGTNELSMIIRDNSRAFWNQPLPSVDAGQVYTNLPRQRSIECTCGYLVNMVERSIKLISPCNPSVRWPLGYEVFAEGTFQNAEEFKEFILESIETCMPEHLGPNDILAFRPDLRYEKYDDGFSLVARLRRHDLRGNPNSACWVT